MEFQIKYLALFCVFSAIYNFEWLWMESLHKSIQVMLEFLKGLPDVTCNIPIYADDTTL